MICDKCAVSTRKRIVFSAKGTRRIGPPEKLNKIGSLKQIKNAKIYNF